MSEAKAMMKKCLCGAELDENGRCPRMEREYYEIFRRGIAVNYIASRSQTRDAEAPESVCEASRLCRPAKMGSQASIDD